MFKMSPERRSHRVEAAKTQLARAVQGSQSAGVLAVEKQAAAILLGQVSRSFEAHLASLEDSAGTAEHDERVVRFRRGKDPSPPAALPCTPRVAAHTSHIPSLRAVPI